MGTSNEILERELPIILDTYAEFYPCFSFVHRNYFKYGYGYDFGQTATAFHLMQEPLKSELLRFHDGDWLESEIDYNFTVRETRFLKSQGYWNLFDTNLSLIVLNFIYF